MQKIVPHLWFDKEAHEAAQYYVPIFRNSVIQSISTIDGTPSGTVNTVAFKLEGYDFAAISAGPYFKFTPAVSFIVFCESKNDVDTFWNKIVKGGTVLMELGAYPFSERYGWAKDKYGLSWQILYAKKKHQLRKIVPSLLFTGDISGKAEDAIKFYTTVFHDCKIESIERYKNGEVPNMDGMVKYSSLVLENQYFTIMDGGNDHDFSFNEAVSFIVYCDSQEEIDYYWNKLSYVPESEQCGWLKDKYGVSWQIVPVIMNEMMTSGDKEKLARVTESFLKMKKFDITSLIKVYEGK